MKAQCQIEQLKNAVYLAERITGRNLTLPILSSLLIIASKDLIKIRATNLSLGIEVEIPAKVEKEGVLAVQGGILYGALSSIIQNENVILDGGDGNLFIQAKKNKIKLKGQPSDDFPTIPLVDGETFDLEVKKLLEGIKAVNYSASISDIKPEMSSVFIYTKDDQLVFVSTDSFRLAEKKVKVRGLPEIKGILIPFKNTTEILRVFGDVGGEVKVNFNKNQISFSSDGIYLTSRVVDGFFPDYSQIIPKTFTTEATLLKQDLLNALKLSNIFSDKFNQVNLVIKPKSKLFELSSANTDVGENKTELDTALFGEDIELAFSHKYFMDCFQSMNTDSLTIRLTEASRPMVVTPVSDNSFLYLIMPMNH